MPKRLIIQVEFTGTKEDEIQMFLKLKSFSSAGAIVKDILMKRLDLSILYQDENK